MKLLKTGAKAMKLSNFRMIETIGTKPLEIEYFAKVNVTTGYLFWKRVEERLICKKALSMNWFFLDNGEYTPEFQAETLERSYEAKEKFYKVNDD
jgi:hypothetical protein